jgi:uncharacterized protein YciI
VTIVNKLPLLYEVIDDYVAQRAQFRDAHLQSAGAAAGRGELLLAGAMTEPDGALLVFRAADRSVAENFARNDPYVVNGLVSHWEVRPWNVVVGQEPADGRAKRGFR